MTRSIRTKEGALRAYDTTLRRYMRENAGGGQYGYDWPTMRVQAPETYARLRELIALARTLPSRAKGKESGS